MIDLSKITGKYILANDPDNYIEISLHLDLLSIEYNFRNVNLVQRVKLSEFVIPFPKWLVHAWGENVGGGISQKGLVYYEITVYSDKSKLEMNLVSETLR